MSRLLISSAFALLCPVLSSAAEVWAPGVSASGGWYDYNKSEADSAYGTVAGMCWAASSSNIIKWWQDQNKDSLPSIVPAVDPWLVFQTVYSDVGSTPTYGINWWINGVTDNKGDLTTPTGYDSSGFPEFENKENSEWPYGNFLSSVYDTGTYKIQVGSNPNDTDGRTISLNILDALESGYALSLSAYSEAGNSNVAHAITLWGAEYTGEGDNRTITKMWITDSDDAKDELIEYTISSKEAGIAFSNGTLSGSLIRYAAGMRSIPEPAAATATLSLLLLCGLTTRRRRR